MGRIYSVPGLFGGEEFYDLLREKLRDKLGKR